MSQFPEAATDTNTPDRAFATRVMKEDWRGEAVTFLRERYGKLRNASKLLARLARTSPRTTEKWLRCERTPTDDSLFNLLIVDKEFRTRMAQFIEEVIAYRKKNGI